jgi:hypothetical protein
MSPKLYPGLLPFLIFRGCETLQSSCSLVRTSPPISLLHLRREDRNSSGSRVLGPLGGTHVRTRQIRDYEFIEQLSIRYRMLACWRTSTSQKTDQTFSKDQSPTRMKDGQFLKGCTTIAAHQLKNRGF